MGRTKSTAGLSATPFNKVRIETSSAKSPMRNLFKDKEK